MKHTIEIVKDMETLTWQVFVPFDISYVGTRGFLKFTPEGGVDDSCLEMKARGNGKELPLCMISMVGKSFNFFLNRGQEVSFEYLSNYFYLFRSERPTLKETAQIWSMANAGNICMPPMASDDRMLATLLAEKMRDSAQALWRRRFFEFSGEFYQGGFSIWNTYDTYAPAVSKAGVTGF